MNKNKFHQLLAITICWTIFSIVLFLNDYAMYKDSWAPQAPKILYPFGPNLLAYALFGALSGSLAAAILVFKMADIYRTKSFASGILNSAILFLILFNVLVPGVTLLFSLVYFQSWEEALTNVKSNNTLLSYLVNMLVYGLLFVGTQFMLQVNDKFGPGVLWKFLKGRYSKPVEEERIFMFLDLKSSTSIAEKLGSTKFFTFLGDYFKDITNPIIISLGEIYQYVGDEIVITWPTRAGHNDSNCLSCFFRVYDAIQDRKDYYQDKYGLIPEFKAGMHIGRATVGEIGVIKKDIIYSGDVLNTTARIQAECNHNNVSLLVSSLLLDQLDLGSIYNSTSLGEIQLRGKEERIELNAVARTASNKKISAIRLHMF